MTGQIPDLVCYDGREFSLTGVDGGPLFDPAHHGLEVRSISTACRRGHICHYSVADDELTLTELAVGMDEPPAEFFGAACSVEDGKAWYRPLQVAVSFTGGPTLGAGFITELYVRIGHQAAWKYQEVRELQFAVGRLVGTHDRSQEMAQVRAAVRPG